MEFDSDALFVMVGQPEISEKKNHCINKQYVQFQEEIQLTGMNGESLE